MFVEYQIEEFSHVCISPIKTIDTIQPEYSLLLLYRMTPLLYVVLECMNYALILGYVVVQSIIADFMKVNKLIAHVLEIISLNQMLECLRQQLLL